MWPARLSILGVGLLGGSLGLAVKRVASDCHRVGYGHRPQTLSKAVKLGAIDEPASDPAAAVTGADLVALCTPVGLFEQILRQIAPALKHGAVVTDVGSTKRSVVEVADRVLPRTAHFIGSHPMAGSEKRGVEFARGDLFQGSVCITTPTPATDEKALESVEQLWRDVGMRLIRLAPAEHDRRVAMISHLPHALAAAVVAIQDADTLALAGRGFADATRIAAGDAGLWRDILVDNADQVRAGLGKLQDQLKRLDALLDPSNQPALMAWLEEAATTRRELKNTSSEEQG